MFSVGFASSIHRHWLMGIGFWQSRNHNNCKVHFPVFVKLRESYRAHICSELVLVVLNVAFKSENGYKLKVK